MPNQTQSENKTSKTRSGSAKDKGAHHRNQLRRKSVADAIREVASINNDDTEIEEANLSPWEAFQEHLRRIDDNTAMYTARDASGKDPEKGAMADTSRSTDPVEQAPSAEDVAKQMTHAIKLKSSDSFSKIMYEFQLKKQQYLERQAAIQRERERKAQEELLLSQEPVIEETQEEEEKEEEEEEEEDFEPDWSDEDDVDSFELSAAAQLHKSAARAWGIIRRHINEITMEKKQKGSTMNWKFLRQTISNMTDMEKGRQNLYEKYLYKPDTWREGFAHFPEELLNRERGRGRKSHEPSPSAGSRPKSRRSQKAKQRASQISRTSGVKSH